MKIFVITLVALLPCILGGWLAKESGKGVDGEKLRQYTTSSISHPEWTNGKSKEAIQEECRIECAGRCDCKGIQYSPTTWDHEECFLMSGSGLYQRSGWSSQLDTSKPCQGVWLAKESGKGVDGEKLRQYTTSSISHPEWTNGKSKEAIQEECRIECAGRCDCKGIQYSPTTWDHQECFLMAGSRLYQRSGWSSQLDTSKPCLIQDSGYVMGSGVSGEKLAQYTTSAMYNPEWMNGMTRDQVLQRCTDECNAREDCQGIQYSPTTWAHQECFLMSGMTTYARSGWSGQIKRPVAN